MIALSGLGSRNKILPNANVITSNGTATHKINFKMPPTIRSTNGSIGSILTPCTLGKFPLSSFPSTAKNKQPIQRTNNRLFATRSEIFAYARVRTVCTMLLVLLSRRAISSNENPSPFAGRNTRTAVVEAGQNILQLKPLPLRQSRYVAFFFTLEIFPILDYYR